MLQEARRDLEERNKRVPTPVWAEHWHAFVVFQAMHTQWRYIAGMSGPLRTGMDYSALPFVLEACKDQVPKRHRQRRSELFAQLKVMEMAVLRVDRE